MQLLDRHVKFLTEKISWVLKISTLALHLPNNHGLPATIYILGKQFSTNDLRDREKGNCHVVTGYRTASGAQREDVYVTICAMCATNPSQIVHFIGAKIISLSLLFLVIFSVIYLLIPAVLCLSRSPLFSFLFTTLFIGLLYAAVHNNARCKVWFIPLLHKIRQKWNDRGCIAPQDFARVGDRLRRHPLSTTPWRTPASRFSGAQRGTRIQQSICSARRANDDGRVTHWVVNRAPEVALTACPAPLGPCHSRMPRVSHRTYVMAPCADWADWPLFSASTCTGAFTRFIKKWKKPAYVV